MIDLLIALLVSAVAIGVTYQPRGYLAHVRRHSEHRAGLERSNDVRATKHTS